MELKRCHDELIYDIGFLDPVVINEKTLVHHPLDTENNIMMGFTGQRTKSYILLAYQFRYVFKLIPSSSHNSK